MTNPVLKMAARALIKEMAKKKRISCINTYPYFKRVVAMYKAKGFKAIDAAAMFLFPLACFVKLILNLSIVKS